MPYYNVLLCGGASCKSKDSESIRKKLDAELKRLELSDDVSVVETGCMGPCELGPVMVVYPEGVFYKNLTCPDVTEIVEEHLLKGRAVSRLFFSSEEKKLITKKKSEIPFFALQKKIVLKNCGEINPEDIEEYIAREGYEAVGRSLCEQKPEQIISRIKKSGLRGRGGAGYPTGLKWESVAQSAGEVKYVVCNADEGDPGAFMDRAVLEGDPHTVIEGMSIAAYAVGASQGFVYIRAEYPLAISRLRHALNQARTAGFLGKNIFESGFSFDIELRIGAGAFVCGEETALLSSLEGKRGTPRPRPPYPSVSGFDEKPTLINNVETYANIRHIILNGEDWFASIGTEKSKGTKVFALSGQITNTGLVEVPMGITLRELIFDIGGGVKDGRKFKAVQLGGPSGGCIPEEFLDTPIEYESLKKLGAMMGSGGVIVMDETTCMPNTAKFFTEFSLDESCGKCVPCRLGVKQMHEYLKKITSGNGETDDLRKMKELGEAVRDTSLCGLGQSSPNPVLSTMNYFRQEYLDHILEKKCSACVCDDMWHYSINPEKCRKCGICVRKCPQKCISKTESVDIDQKQCVHCGVCLRVCPFGAVDKIPGRADEN